MSFKNNEEQIFLYFDEPDEWKIEEKYKFKKLDFGKWSLQIPMASDGSCLIKHLTNLKVFFQFSLKIYILKIIYYYSSLLSKHQVVNYSIVCVLGHVM